MGNFRIRNWRDHPEAARSFQAAVSLHSHTLYSREPLTFLPEAVRRSGILARLWWTPPLSPRQAWLLEKSQIEIELGLTALVSLTDHDSIEAPLMLRVLNESRNVPVSVEWTVPFRDTFFHLGVHNLPGQRAQELFAEMAAYTDDPTVVDLRGILGALHSEPDTLVVFNHPMWDEKRIGQRLHQQRVGEFLMEFGFAIHALEWNGFRSGRENSVTVQLARETGKPLVSGGDRHGKEPSSVLNLTTARSFAEFAEGIRGGEPSELLLMPQQSRPRLFRVIDSVADVLRDNPDHGLRWTRWRDRAFCRCSDGQTRSISQIWSAVL